MTEATSSDLSPQQLGIRRSGQSGQRGASARGVELQRWAAVCASSATGGATVGGGHKFKKMSQTTGATGRGCACHIFMR